MFIIVFEGMDLVGKSTAIEYCAEEMYKKYGMTSNILRLPKDVHPIIKDTAYNANKIKDPKSNAIVTLTANLITLATTIDYCRTDILFLDRYFFSTLIYNCPDYISGIDETILDIIRDINPPEYDLVVHLTCKQNELVKRLRERNTDDKEDTKVVDNYKQYQDRYEEVFKKYHRYFRKEKSKYFTTDTTDGYDSLIKKILSTIHDNQ